MKLKLLSLVTILSVTFILCGISSEAYAKKKKKSAKKAQATQQAQVNNEWRGDLQNVEIFWEWDNTNKRTQLIDRRAGVRPLMGRQSNLPADADACVTNNFQPPPDGIAGQLRNCISCCSIFPLSDGTERFNSPTYDVDTQTGGTVDAANSRKRQVAHKYCICECATRAGAREAVLNTLCKKPREEGTDDNSQASIEEHYNDLYASFYDLTNEAYLYTEIIWSEVNNYYTSLDNYNTSTDSQNSSGDFFPARTK